MAEKYAPLGILARFLDLSVKRIPQLANEGIIPQSQNRRYELEPCVIGYIRYLRKRALGHDLSSQSLAGSRAQLVKANAEIAELKRAQLAGELVERRLVDQAWSLIGTAIRNHMLALPNRLAARIGTCREPAEVQQLLRSDIEAILDEFDRVALDFEADDDEGVSTDAAGEAEADDEPDSDVLPPAAPAAKSNGKPVGRR
jgi:phage terminase Nu1 subunit (DNA packaging protein)